MTSTRRFLAAVAVTAASLGLGACGAGEPPASIDAPTRTPPEPPPAMAEEKMTLERQVLAAKADLARRLEIPADGIEVLEAKEVTWPDASLGCPEAGMAYAQVLTPGVLIVLTVAGERYRYHGRMGAVPASCPPGRAGQPLPAASR